MRGLEYLKYSEEDDDNIYDKKIKKSFKKTKKPKKFKYDEEDSSNFKTNKRSK